MNPLLLDILPLLREKYCCSQILILMALHARGEENSGLIRALWGLCEGMAQGGQSCRAPFRRRLSSVLSCGPERPERRSSSHGAASDQRVCHLVRFADCSLRRHVLSPGGRMAGNIRRTPGTGERRCQIWSCAVNCWLNAGRSCLSFWPSMTSISQMRAWSRHVHPARHTKPVPCLSETSGRRI